MKRITGKKCENKKHYTILRVTPPSPFLIIQHLFKENEGLPVIHSLLYAKLQYQQHKKNTASFLAPTYSHSFQRIISFQDASKKISR